MKKYIKFIVILLLCLLVVIFIFKKYNNSFDIKPQLKYSELEDYILEYNDCLIYVMNDKKVDEVKKYFENKNIEIIYMNLNKNETNLFENKYGINLPKLVYFKDGVLRDYSNFIDVDNFLNRNGLLK